MQLCRRFVGNKLAAYYNLPSDRVVGGIDQKINFASLWGELHYKRLLQKKYEERKGHWFTPVEVFQPYYSNTLANFIARTVEATQKGEDGDGDEHDICDIIEIGCGRGTNAEMILDHLKLSNPDIYSKIQYTMIDSSPTLHKLQQDRLLASEHGDKMSFDLIDIMDVAEQKATLLSADDRTPTVLIGLEILDNLPHDKIHGISRREVHQAVVQEDGNSTLKENFVPLSDPLLSRVLQTVPSFIKSYPVWVPSVACGFLDQVFKQRPNSSIVLADFDWLPPPDFITSSSSDDSSSPQERASTWAEGEPITTDLDGIDYPCYIDSPPHCDILFPTDFEKLASYVKRIIPRTKAREAELNYVTRVRVEKQSEFLERYGPEQIDATKSWLTGYSPLLQDFANCSVLTVTNERAAELTGSADQR